MKTIALFLGIACLLALSYARPADDYEYEDAVAAAPPKPAPRSSLLNRRNQLNRAVPPKPSSTTPAPASVEEEEIVDEEEPFEDVQPETSSTTESGRRIKGGVVRPFRSNQDLLETLKKRREQAVINKAHAKAQGGETVNADSAPVEQEKPASKARPSNARGRYNKKENAVISEEEQQPSSTAATRNNGRRFRN